MSYNEWKCNYAHYILEKESKPDMSQQLPANVLNPTPLSKWACPNYINQAKPVLHISYFFTK